jgi:cytochrome c oxidase subunit 1
MIVRGLTGLPVWNAETALVAGAILGGVAFMIAAGTVSDWFKWAKGQDTPLHHGAPEGKATWTRYLSVDYSHKIIGIQYVVTGIMLLLVGGGLAIIFRFELVESGMQFLTLDGYNTIMSAHGIIMIASILLGIGGLANYLVPLMIGASDMAFPRLNAFAFWINVPGALLVVLAMFLGGWDTGWTGYPPLSALAPLGVDYFFLGVYFIGLSSILGGLNLIVTILRMRAPGMSLFRMPIFVWAVLATSIIQLTGTQLIGLSFVLVLLQRLFDMPFFDPAGGGKPILFQHLFWFYSHPAVYIFVLPGFGLIAELLPVFSRKPLFGYKWVALSSLAIAFIGFLVWAHHMFTSGMADFLRVPFSYATLLVAVPTGVKFFSWVATMWGGKLYFPTPMLFIVGAISVFLIGGLTGPPLGTVTSDLLLHDTYYVVGHFHATMFGGFVFPFFAALYYWFPKATGRMYNERMGKLHFWLMLPAFWVQSLGQMYIGMMGMRRRIADYDPALGIEGMQMAITIAGTVIGISVLICIFNLVRSARKGRVAERNPWRSRSPEWQIPSPIPEQSYARPFVVVGDPYDYGLPGSTYVRMSPAGASE